MTLIRSSSDSMMSWVKRVISLAGLALVSAVRPIWLSTTKKGMTFLLERYEPTSPPHGGAPDFALSSLRGGARPIWQTLIATTFARRTDRSINGHHLQEPI